jgi:sugar/nucleoside kinase (ribokinase family)
MKNMKINKKKDKNKQWDILGIGHPLLDIAINIDEKMLKNLNIKKGSMNLVSEKESRDVLKKLGKIKLKLALAGSASNMLSGANALGNRVSFLGVVGKDKYGKMYQEKMEKEGVISHLVFHEGNVTGHSIILITPDGERTMATHLGAASNFGKEHIKEDEIKKSKILHVEGYKLENPNTRRALLHAIKIAKENQTIISMDLSDTGLIRRNKKLFKDIVKKYIDVVFANEDEAMEFSGKKNPAEALKEIAKNCKIAVVKLGAKGSLIEQGKKVFKIKPYKVDMINTNGAGDTYAAGILHGLINGLKLQDAGKIASHIAGLVVASSGARLDKKHINSIKKYKIHPVK